MSAEFKKIAAARDRGVQGRVPQPLPRPRRRRPDRRGPAARGDEHRRQAGQARRARPLRRVGLDADRGLGRQHRHPHPRRARLRHAAAVRAGRRPRPAADELRRRTTTGMFDPEYAEVYGVPFSFIPCSRLDHGPEAGPAADARARARGPHRLRDHLPAPARLPLRPADASGSPPRFTDDSQLALSTADVPTRTENAPDRRRVEHPHARRPRSGSGRNEVAFLLAKLTLEKLLPRRRRATTEAAGSSRSCSAIAKRWLAECVTLQGRHLPAAAAARSSSRTTPPTASTRRSSQLDDGHAGAQADPAAVRHRSARPATSTSTRPRPVYATDADKCHISHVVADTDSGSRSWRRRSRRWPRSSRYVKNQGLGFTSRTRSNGEERQLHPRLHRLHRRRPRPGRPAQPDRRSDRRDEEGQGRQGRTARDLWVPAVNNHGGFGRWAFVEVDRPVGRQAA